LERDRKVLPNLLHNKNISQIPKDHKDITKTHKPVSFSTNLIAKRKLPLSSISSCKTSTSHSMSLLDKTSMHTTSLPDTKRLKVRHISTTATSKLTSITSSSSNTSFPGAIGSIQAPNSIKSILRPHQIEGIVFLWNCLTGASSAFQQVLNSRGHDIENEKLSSSQQSLYGAILADEMGLGKTLMTITVLFSLHRRNRNDVS
jgi:SNF2 family DNA or RNA helicase